MDNDTISRQAAIDALEAKKDKSAKGDIGCFYNTIIQNNIDALKGLPSAQPETCEDAVSRNAIIQKLNTMDRYVSEELILCDTDKKFPKNEVFIVDDVYEEIVEKLPSVQPERKKGKWIDKGWNGDWQYQTDGRGRCWHEWQCSECNDITKGAKWDFCPNCGAKMEVEHET